MTLKERKEAYQKLSRAAYAVESVYGRYGSMGDYARLRNTIEEQEKAHRRFAPTGHKHRLPIKSAVDYFVVRCFQNAVKPLRSEKPTNGLEWLFEHLSTLRDDYLMVLLFVKGRVIPRWKKENGEELSVFKKACDLTSAIDYDYTDLV